MLVAQTLEGPFSAVSKPISATEAFAEFFEIYKICTLYTLSVFPSNVCTFFFRRDVLGGFPNFYLVGISTFAALQTQHLQSFDQFSINSVNFNFPDFPILAQSII